MRKQLVIVLMIMIAAAAWAQTPGAVIRELRGTVETKDPGSSEWRPAALGQELEAETLLSTGFRSEAALDLGNSVLLVRPLTRLSLGEIAAAAGADRVEIQLRAGRIRADVRPPAGGNVEFTVRSPTATASVRGTSFEFDTVNLRVEEGTVSFSGADQTAVFVAAGQSSSPDPVSGRTALPVETAAALAPPPPAGVDAAAPAPVAAIPGSGPAHVDIAWE